MKKLKLFLAPAALCIALFVAFAPTQATAETSPIHDMVTGSATAPITVIEYANFTCSHCADFYNDVFPLLEKKYVDTGKVKFIFRDFPTDAYGLKASALARCMPEAQFFPFIKILFKNYMNWIRTPKPEETLLQYASMSGLSPEKAKACLDDTKLMDALVELRTTATDKYDIQGTPTFLVNNGEEKIVGARSIEDFSAIFDKILAKKK